MREVSWAQGDVAESGTDRSTRGGEGQAEILPYQWAVLGAIVLMPLQKGFTLDLGFPLKPSELLTMAAIALFVMRREPERRPWLLPHRLVLALLGLTFASTFARWVTAPPTGTWRGYPRSPQTDLVMYLGYATLVLTLWFLLTRLTWAHVRSALHLATWVCGAATLLQLVLFRAGQIAVLEALNYETEARGLGLGEEESAQRTGPFVEGQHLGFVSGYLFVHALRDRRYVTALVALGCIVYSQSTTAIVGVAAAAVVAIVTRPSISRWAKLALAVVGFVIVYLMSGGLRLLIRLQMAKLGIGDAAVDGRLTDRSLDTRFAKTEIATTMMFDHLALGVGPGRYGFYFFDYATAPPIPAYYWLTNHRAIAENAYLHVGAELGIIALGVFVGLVLLLCFRLRHRHPGDLATAAFAAVAIATQSSWTFIPIWVVLGYLTLAAYTDDPEALGSAETGPDQKDSIPVV